jgi:formate-dependent nitrite reductase cytochrome c552 subunit
MAHVIIRGANGRRHEVDFEDADITVELHASEDHVELVIEASDMMRRHRTRSASRLSASRGIC